MHTKTVIVLDMIALMLTIIWIIRGAIKGLSSADLIYNYIYSSVVFIAFILTLIDNED